MRKSHRTPSSLWRAVRAFVTEELFLLFLYACIVLQHGIIDLFDHGPDCCTRLIFDLAEAWSVIKMLRARQTVRRLRARNCTNRGCNRKDRRPTQRKVRTRGRK